MKHFTSRILCAFVAVAFSVEAFAAVPVNYYSSLSGLSGAELKTAICNLTNTDVNMLKYGSGNFSTWWGFYLTDRRDDNTCVDRYSYETFYFGERGSSIDGTNIEHSFPKSWWGGTENNAYKDLFNLMPCESSINQSKSNYPMGKVVTVETAKGDNGCTKVGIGEDGSKYWEPADEWKGDFARGYMYMATTYQDLTWVEEIGGKPNPGLQMLENGTYPTLLPWAYNLFMEWARTDEVDQIETHRADLVEMLQGNRNPYVDFPNLMEYVWGDSTHIAFDPVTSVKSADVTGLDNVLFECTCISPDDGGCAAETTVSPGFDVWTCNDKGWHASAYKSKACHASDVTLYTPWIDLSDFASAVLNFEMRHYNFADSTTDPTSLLAIVVEDDKGYSEALSGIFWNTIKNTNYRAAGPIDFSKYAGKRVRVGFRYTSTASEAPTWDIRNLSLAARGGSTTVHPQVFDDAADCCQPSAWYDLSGVRINPLTYKGVAICRQGSKAVKRLLR